MLTHKLVQMTLEVSAGWIWVKRSVCVFQDVCKQIFLFMTFRDIFISIKNKQKNPVSNHVNVNMELVDL